MANDPTQEEVRASIVPKSDQLNADDLLTGPITVTITGVRRGDKEQPIVIDIDGHRPFKPCKSMRRVLIATFSDDPKAWVGQQMTLYCDPTVLWAGVKVGGIRISHLSGLENPRTFMLTQTRGKRSEVTIRPVVKPEYSDQINAALAAINAAENLDLLKEFGAKMKSQPKAVQDAVRAAYGLRLKALSAGTLSALAQFEQEIEAAKDSRSKLVELALRVDEFDQAGPELTKRIEAYHAAASENS